MAKKRKQKKNRLRGVRWVISLLIITAVLWFIYTLYQNNTLVQAPPMDDIDQSGDAIGTIIAPIIQDNEAITLIFEDELPNIVPLTEKETVSPSSAPSGKPRLALIIDDVGYNMQVLHRLITLPFPLTVSILPDAPFAKQAAQLAHDNGMEVMLHMPMETTSPKYQSKMEDFYLHSAMSKEIFTQVFEDALAKVPYVVGINNHMGSALTADKKSMQWLMELCKKHGLFFIDSKTSAKSVGGKIAKQKGLTWNQRDIFLDNDISNNGLSHAWGTTKACMKRKPSCIILAHPHLETINFLEKTIPHDSYQSFTRIKHVLIRPQN